MKRCVALVLIANLSLAFLVSCGGGNGTNPPETEEFTVYMNLWQLELSDGMGSPCPKASADLALRLSITGNEVTGEASLMNTAMLGAPIEIMGVVSDDSIEIDPFSVDIDWIPPSPVNPAEASTISFTFSSFVGNPSDLSRDKTTREMEVFASGRVSEVGEGDIVICEGNFTLEGLADECLPRSFFPHSDCLAESISDACNFVTGCATTPGPGGIHGDFWIGCGRQTDCVCEVLSCDNLICPFPTQNIRWDPERGLVGIDPDNPDEFTFTCGTGFGP
jgi:hypothetical protein